MTEKELFKNVDMNGIYNKLYSYNSAINILIGGGNLGKTFTYVKRVLKKNQTTDKVWVMLMQNKELVTQLTKAGGYKLFSRQIKWAKDNNDNDYYKYLTGVELGSEHDGTCELSCVGSTVYHKKKVKGFIIPITEYEYIKGSNYDISHVYFDEFIQENTNHKTQDYVRAVVSILGSIQRTNKCVFTLSANPIRLDNPIMSLFNFQHIKMGQTLKVKDNQGTLAVCHYIDQNKPQIKALTDYVKANNIGARMGCFGGQNLNYRHDGTELNPNNIQLTQITKQYRYIATLVKGISYVHIYRHYSTGQYISTKTKQPHKPVYYCGKASYQNSDVELNKDICNNVTQIVVANKMGYTDMGAYNDLINVLDIDKV